jgi:hypothetical protein
VVPPGGAAFSSDMIIRDSGELDNIDRNARETFAGDLPSEVLEYMPSSRYCEVDELSGTAWGLFGNYAPGWNRVHQIFIFWTTVAPFHPRPFVPDRFNRFPVNAGAIFGFRPLSN